MEKIIEILGGTQILNVLKIEKLSDVEVAFSWAIGWLIRNIADPNASIMLSADQALGIQGYMATVMDLQEHEDVQHYIDDTRACLKLMSQGCELVVSHSEAEESMEAGLSPYQFAKKIINRYQALVEAEKIARIRLAEKK